MTTTDSVTPKIAIVGAVTVTVAEVGVSAYIGRQALAGDERFASVRKIALAFAALGGTSFRGADLTDADFTQASLKSTDFRSNNFRNTILTRTRWHKAKNLELVRPGETYLRNPRLCPWLIEKGQNKNFDRQDLRGVNLEGAKLADASFIGANLSEANLRHTDLSRAMLVQTQLDETDLTGATLTGACIEDWGITSHTKLHGVKCKYVFMRVPTKEDPDRRRKPDNWKEKFQGNDFADFIKPIVDTLDLYHTQGIDPHAIAISFKQLAENHPEAELEIVAMEKRGQGNLLLRAKTAEGTNHSELNAEYFSTYNQLKAQLESQQKLLAEKDDRIQKLENMIMTVLERPNFYAETYQHQGDIMPEAPKYDQRGAQFAGGVADTVQGDQVGGNIYNYIPDQKQTLAEIKAEIQQLLCQLQTQGYKPEEDWERAARDISEQAKSNPSIKNKLVKWKQFLGNAAAEGIIGEAAVEIVKLALKLLGVSLS